VPQGSGPEHGHYLHDHYIYNLDNFLFCIVHGPHHGDHDHDLADHRVSDCSNASSIPGIRFGRNK
jgi:hypothetical protein